MKIGILTHHYINNFGAFLQAYSLQEAIRELYPNDEVYIINDINIKHFIINTGGWFRFYKDKENLSIWLQKIHLPKTFSRARKKFLNQTKFCISTKQVNKLQMDYIIVGSDEVWNYNESKGNAKIKFGYGLENTELVAYAPSVGGTAGGKIPEYVLEGIRKFHKVSARDNLTEQLATKIRKEEITRVTDPTFLIDIPDEKVPNIIEPYVLFYYCDGIQKKEKEQIYQWAKENGLSVYGAGETDKNYTSTTINLTPFQWVWMFRHASYVVTGTFHGAVFSMLNRRQFACYLTNPSRIKKVGSLLEEFQLENRQTDGSARKIIDTLKNNIDYEQFDEIKKKKIDTSKKFLRDAIEDRG